MERVGEESEKVLIEDSEAEKGKWAKAYYTEFGVVLGGQG